MPLAKELRGPRTGPRVQDELRNFEVEESAGTEAFRRAFREDGFAIVPGFLSSEETDALQNELMAAHPKDGEGSRLDRSALFFRHNLFFESEAVQRFLTGERLVRLATSLAGPDVWVRWDHTIAKQPGGEEFPWHQDNGYNGLLREHFQMWLALTDQTAENGGLWIQPGSHKGGLRKHSLIGTHVYSPGDPDQAVSVTAKRGDLIFFSSYLLHMTTPNVTDRHRLAYVAELMPTSDYDPNIAAPFFLMAEGGEPSGRFVDTIPAINFGNRFRYWMRDRKKGVVRRFKRVRNRVQGREPGEGVM